MSVDDTGINSNKVPYRVLARKYRPQTFDDLIGQEPMVQTLKNAFRLDRIAQAYMLTGVRGVGKTTTARILARALNYETDQIKQPTIDMEGFGIHCEAIVNSNHIDVLEMDAASHTGINDIREIIEAVKYKPASARYKVYIIDEVHMLSTAAFNGLLKTLEEPPEHVKFIFATTEIRKVPVTVLSRCQRFDLRRIDGTEMTDFLGRIANKENVNVPGEALSLIARASEGSVRDALSLLDQAIAHGAGNDAGEDSITLESLRTMLGLSDHARIIDLFEAVMKGDIKTALAELKAQYDIGADPFVVLSDLAEFTHLVTAAKVAGRVPATKAMSNLEIERAEQFGETLTVRALSRAWQILLKGLDEVQSARNPLIAADMVLVRLCYVADLPTPDEALKVLRDEPVANTPAKEVQPSTLSSPSNGPSGGVAQALAETQPAPSNEPAAPLSTPRPTLAVNNPAPTPSTESAGPRLKINRFEDLVALAEEKRDLRLRQSLENHVHLIAFEDGRIEFSLAPQATERLANDLKARLREWSGHDWSVSVVQEGGAPPLAVQRAEEARQMTRDAEHDPTVAAILKQFPGSKVVNVTYFDNESNVPENDDTDM